MMHTLGEEELRALLLALPYYVWTGDSSGKSTYLDPRLLALLGMNSTSEVNESWFERVHPDDREAAESAWREAVAAGREFRVEWRLLRADGTYRWFESRACPILGSDGRPKQWVGSIDDIEKEVATREALKLEQLRLQKIADASPGMLYSFWSAADASRATFPYVSPTFEKLFQVKGEELAKDAFTFFRLGNQEDGPALIAAVEQSRRDLTLWRHQWRVTAPEVGELWLEAHSMPVREPDGSTSWHGTVSDITDRRAAEAELRELNTNLERRVGERTEELEIANRELEAFSYSVSHDLREPLRAVNGFSQALLDDFGATLPADAHRFLQNIRQGGLRMGRLIDDLLAFSRLSRQPLQRRRIDIRRLVEDCLKIVTPPGSKAKVTLGELADCDADAGLTQQVFTNVLSNAFKYSQKRETPEIHVTSSRDEHGYLVYSVRDNGTGFDMKYAGKLFQVFQRLHRATEFEGTGVGLAIVNRIVVRHGGRIWVQAAPDEGATFHFTLSK